MALRYLLSMLCIAALMWSSLGQDDIRLVDGPHGPHTGRVEVSYNGTWGTICDDFWSTNDARVACRMLGFDDPVCAVHRAQFDSGTGPIWMDNLFCLGTEEKLEFCSFNGWGDHSCTHNEDAGLICVNSSLVGVPENVTKLRATTTSLVVGWTTPDSFPPGTEAVRFRVAYKTAESSFYRLRFFYVSRTALENQTEYNVTLTVLERNTLYNVRVRTEIRYDECFLYMPGNYSEVMDFTTNSHVQPPMYPVRLVPPSPDLPFMGRVEIFYNQSWGTVCDDRFFTTEGRVVCTQLGYNSTLCVASRALFGRGSGPIWMDDVDCRFGQERLEDCTFDGWGVHNCDHGDDVGVICIPDDYPGMIQNFTAKHVGATSATFKWNAFDFPSSATVKRYRIQYETESSFFPRTISVFSTSTEYTIQNLLFGASYNVTIRPEIRFTYCFSYVYGDYIDPPVQIRTKETAPTGPPTDFHVVVLNSTAIEAQWNLPLFNHRQGIIRGYRLYVEIPSGQERAFNITDNTTVAFIIGQLKPSSRYVVSILAYTTVGNGPRSIHLTVKTRESDFTPYIVYFGIFGDGKDRAQRFTYQNGINVHCGTGVQDADIGWHYSNGSRVGHMMRDLREGHFENGTASLEIGNGRRLNYCDAGVYTCVANISTGGIHRKNFTLLINISPPAPSAPYPILVGSTSILVGWDEPLCDGGHRISSFNIQYITGPSFFGPSEIIRNIDPSRRNYTVFGLIPDTSYNFRVQVVSADLRAGSYSPFTPIQTLPPAPSEPRNVSASLVAPTIILVVWVAPANANGQIIHYTVYAIPIASSDSRRKRQSPVSVPGTISKVFPGTVTAGNITVPSTSVIYQFQVTASVYIAAVENEGTASPITADTTVFVPDRELPKPVNLRATQVRNSSITLRWGLPPPPFEPISEFVINYSGLVEWRSRGDILIRFDESGEASTHTTSVTISSLTPDTEYRFGAYTVTEKGRGAEVAIRSKTDRATADKLAFLHIRLGRIRDCVEFQNAPDIGDKINDIKDSLVSVLNSDCNCGLTSAHIRDDELSCRQGLVDQVSYRARILGTNNYSAIGLVELLQSWANGDHSSINIGASRLEVDPSCPVFLDNLNAPDCPIPTVPTPSSSTTTSSSPPTETAATPPTSSSITKTTPPTSSSTTKTTPPTSSSLLKETVTRKPPPPSEVPRISSGEIGGIIIGATIAVLLLILIAVIAAFVLKSMKKKSINIPVRKHQDDQTPFADLGPDGEKVRDSGMFESGTLPSKEASTWSSSDM